MDHLLHPTQLLPLRVFSSPETDGCCVWQNETVLMNCGVLKAQVAGFLRTEPEPCREINTNDVCNKNIFTLCLTTHAQLGSCSSTHFPGGEAAH